MPTYTWHRGDQANTCTHIDSSPSGAAAELAAHLSANNIRCRTNGARIEFAEPQPFIEVIRASEKYLGTKLLNG